MAVYAAYLSSMDEKLQPVRKPRKRYAHWSLAKLKEKLRPFPHTEWVIAKYRGKWLSAMVCQAIENPIKVEADEVGDYVVTRSGRVQHKNYPTKKTKRKKARRAAA